MIIEKEIHNDFKRDLKKLLTQYNALITVNYDMYDRADIYVEFKENGLSDIDLGENTDFSLEDL